MEAYTCREGSLRAIQYTGKNFEDLPAPHKDRGFRTDIDMFCRVFRYYWAGMAHSLRVEPGDYILVDKAGEPFAVLSGDQFNLLFEVLV